jgi:CubicO group peptidase (beta-lactamase class C family)
LDLDAVRAALDAAVGAAVAGGEIPGAVAIAGRSDAACAPAVHGVRRHGGPPATADTRYDLASLTKVVATLPALLRLAGEGRLDLDAPLRTWFPSAGWLRVPSLGDRTAGELLAHASGLPAWAPFMGIAARRRTVIGHALASELPHGRGEVVYSDLGFIVLGALVERVTGLRQDAYLREAVTGPLGLAEDELGYRPLPPDGAPPPPPDVPVAASEDCGWRMRLLEGEVHDEAAWIMGGVAGHAGLFGTAAALARVAQAWLAGDATLGPPELRAQATRRATGPGRPARGLGWLLAPDGDEGGLDPARAWRAPRGFGHTGFTGTSLWIDPQGDRFCVLLTNRVHPTRHGGAGVAALRRAVHAAVFGATEGSVP